jgi:sulfoquinovosidase
MKRINSIHLSLIFALLLPQCGDEPSEEGYELSNGARIRGGGAGDLELLRDGRTLFALADVARPQARTFRESFFGPLAIWNFTRTEEQIFTIDQLQSVEQSAAGVVVRYASAEGELTMTVTASSAGEDATALRFQLQGLADGADSIAIPVRCDERGTFHGFGEQYNATDQRGEAFQLFVTEQGIGREPDSYRLFEGDAHTTYFPMPWYIDARGSGVLFETPYRVDVDLCAADPEVAWFEVISGDPVEIMVFHGPTPLDVIRQLGDHLGRPAPPPEWAYGLWVSAQGGRDAVLDEVERLEANNVPFAAIWSQDWTGLRRNMDGGFGVQYRWEADEELYPDLAGMIDELHGRGYRFLAYANPFIAQELENHFPEMDSRGLLMADPVTGDSYVFPAPNGQSAHPDLTNPEAREYVQEALRAMVLELGIDGWMADFAEWTPLDAQLHDGRDPMAYHNLFPIDWQAMTREVMDEARPDGDWVMFARSGFTGVQAVAQIHWAGDQEATWSETDGLPTVVPALINMGLAGQPYVTHDIGGFSGGPSTKELFQRWVELGAFTPIMRTHEGNQRDLNWSWRSDEETIRHFRRFARIHDALAPELIALSQEAQQSSAPLLRHLMLVFPEDEQTWPISDQFMLGDELLIAPVLHQGETRRDVYLPLGSWYHLWTGERFEGGQWVDVEAPIGSPPAFSRGRERADLRAIE